jgi:hypothetical protein
VTLLQEQGGYCSRMERDDRCQYERTSVMSAVGLSSAMEGIVGGVCVDREPIGLEA